MGAPARAAVVLAATGAVAVGDGRLVGFFVGTTSSLTLKIWDSLSATGNVMLDTTTALTTLGWYAFPASFATGCFVTFGGTGKVTFIYERI